MIDLKIMSTNESDTGDLNLTASRVNINGDIITKQFGQNVKEIKDLAISSNEDTLKQMIFNRLQTQNPDWYHHPNIGANLEDLVGEQNTKSTADYAIQQIQKALTYDGLIGVGDLNVRAVPVNASEVVFFINIVRPVNTTMYVAFDYSSGVKEVGTV